MPVNSFSDYYMSWTPTLDRGAPSLYRALAAQLEADIRSGVLKPGTRLPPQRELADYLDVNVSTVSKAIKQCMLKGLLSATVGSGTFVSYDAISSGRLLTPERETPVIDLGATVPEPSGNTMLLDMTREIFASDDACQLFSYRPIVKDDWQRDAARLLFRRCGLDADAASILPSPDGQNGLTAVLAACFRRGDRLAVDDHTYPGVKTAAAMLGIRLAPIPTGPDGMDLDTLEAVCKNERVRGVYVISASHNPTTATMPPHRRDRLARIAEQYNCLVLEDGTYQLLSGGARTVADRIPHRAVYLVSLSKAIAPGLRMAYLSVPPEHYGAVSDALYSMNVGVVPLMAELAARIVASGRFEPIVAGHMQATCARNALVDRYLPPETCLGGGAGIFRWLLLPERTTGAAFEARALEHGVQVFAAERFAVGHTAAQRAVRLSVCAPETPEQLERGLRILAKLYATQ